jgi:hypothetical protein
MKKLKAAKKPKKQNRLNKNDIFMAHINSEMLTVGCDLTQKKLIFCN